MKTIASALLLAAFSAFFSANVFCQNKVDHTIEDLKNGHLEPPENRAADLDKMMRDGLELTDQQAATVHEINLRFAEKSEREVVRSNLGQWSKYWKILSIQREKDAELELVLTKKQFKKYAGARDAAIWKGVKTLLF